MITDRLQATWDHSMSRMVSEGNVYCHWARSLDGYRRNAHCHEGIEIVYCEHGDGTFHVAGKDHVLSDGVVLAFPAILPHFPLMHRNYERWMICFHPTAFKRSTFDSSIQPIVHYRIDPYDQQRVRHIYREVKNEVTSRRDESERYIALLLEQLFIIIRRNQTKEQSAQLTAPSINQRNFLPAILSYIELHYHDSNLSVEQLAQTFHYAPGHIWRTMRDAIGRSPIQYINERRLINARKLLVSTNRPISVIAEMTGFRSASYFSRVFRDQTGCTPNEYRRRSRERIPKRLNQTT